MKIITKRIASLILALSMIAGILPVQNNIFTKEVNADEEGSSSDAWVEISEKLGTWAVAHALEPGKEYLITRRGLDAGKKQSLGIDLTGTDIAVAPADFLAYAEDDKNNDNNNDHWYGVVDRVTADNTWYTDEAGHLYCEASDGNRYYLNVNEENSGYSLALGNQGINAWSVKSAEGDDNISDTQSQISLKTEGSNYQAVYLSQDGSKNAAGTDNEGVFGLKDIIDNSCKLLIWSPEYTYSYAKLDGPVSYTVDKGDTSFNQEKIMEATKVLLAGSSVSYTPYDSNNTTGSGNNGSIEIITHTKTEPEILELSDSGVSYTWDRALNTDETGVYNMSISIADTVIGTIAVNVVGIESVQYTGAYWFGTGLNRAPDLSEAKALLTYYGGSQKEVTIADGLKITGYDITKSGSYVATVSYMGQIIENVQPTVYVSEDPYYNIKSASTYPEYPKPGSVRIDKTATNTEFDWYNTGVTKVELDVAGVAVKNGIDVILVTDISNSMGRWYKDAEGNDITESPGQKLDEAMEAAKTLAAKLLHNNDDNKATNNSISFVTFGGYDADNYAEEAPKRKYKEGGVEKEIDYLDSTRTVFVYEQSIEKARQSFEGTKFISYSKPADIVQITDNNGNTVSGYNSGGTNYDYAFAEAAHAVEKLKEAYSQANDNAAYDSSGREIVVLFMTDGAPTYYNYECVRLTGTSKSYLYGTETPYPVSRPEFYADVANSLLKIKKVGNVYKQYNNQTGAWDIDTNAVAEESFTEEELKSLYVWRKNSATGERENTGKTYEDIWIETSDKWYDLVSEANEYAVQLNAMVDSFYAVGFKMDEDLGISKHCYNWSTERFISVLSGVAGVKNGNAAVKSVILANNDIELIKTYSEIMENVSYSGREAIVHDEIKSEFKLFRGEDIKYISDVNGSTSVENVTPLIEVKKYALYMSADNIPEGKTIGDRTGEYETLESVSFQCNSEGEVIAAYSDKVLNDSGEPVNILNANGSEYTINAKNFTFYSYSEGWWEYFDWYIPEISEYEYALSYYAYLRETNPNYEVDYDGDGIGDANRGEGIYDTNQSAKLTYIDINGEKAEKVFPIPKKPWGYKLLTTVEYYLVNAEGQPVNRAGDVIPFANRIKVGEAQTVYFTYQPNDTLNHTIRGADYLPGGYEMQSPDSYYTLNTIGSKGTLTVYDPMGEYASTVWVNPVEAGTSESGGLIYDLSASNVAFGVLLTDDIPVEESDRLKKDQIVVDYGKKIIEDVFDNDSGVVLSSNTYKAKDGQYIAELVGFDKYSSDSRYLEYIQKSPGSVSYQGEYGLFSIADGKVQYEPQKTLSSVERVFTVVKFTEAAQPDNYYYLYQEFDVIPATNVYYETDFAGNIEQSRVFQFEAATTDSNGWYEKKDIDEAADSTDTADYLQDDGSIGTTEGRESQIYGYDSSYQNDKLLSNTSSFFVNGAGTTKELNTVVKFSFKGTGLDIISRTGAVQGMIRVTVYKSGNTSDYQSRVSVLNKAESEWGELYQIPVISIEDLPYGNHDVVIEVFKEAEYQGAFAALSRGNEFYFDAVRIYNPLGLHLEGDSDDIGKTAYLTDGEAYPEIAEVRDLLIEGFDVDGSDENKEGVVFIERFGSDGSAGGNPTHNYQFAEYKSIGPNNETYLSEGQAVVFKLTGINSDSVGSIDVGAKAVDGSTVKLKATIAGSIDFTAGSGNVTTVEHEISSASSQYFELYGKDSANRLSSFGTDSNGKGCAYVFITNSAESDNTDPGNEQETGAKVLSITDIKVAYTNTDSEIEGGSQSLTYTSFGSLLDFADACYVLTADDSIEESDTDKNKVEEDTNENSKNKIEGGWRHAKSIRKTLFFCRILSIKRGFGYKLFLKNRYK